MAKNAMRKVSNSVSKVVADTKNMSPINLAILVVSVAIVVVLVILLVKRSKREGFALMNLSDASWVTKGEDGVMGEDGEDGAQGPQGPPGDDYIPNQADKDALYNEFKGKLMGEMVSNKLIVNEGTDENPKYFPVGVIGMKTIIDGDKRRINHDNMNISQEHFKITYNKKAKNSYVKITYSICFTGHNCRGFTMRVFAEDGSEKTQIGATQGQNGPWHGDFQRIAPQTNNIIGIDNSNTTGEKTYFCMLDNEGRNDNNSKHTFINGVMHSEYNAGWKTHKWHTGLLKSSCTIEEIMPKPLENNETHNLNNFVNN